MSNGGHIQYIYMQRLIAFILITIHVLTEKFLKRKTS